MPIIKTTKDLGLSIRSRRKQVGWDQATLAKQVGVSRQWIIDIEKGKPRAEIALILRALNTLNLSLYLDNVSKNAASKDLENHNNSIGRPRVITTDINQVIENNRSRVKARDETNITSSQINADKHLSEVINPMSSTSLDLLRSIDSTKYLTELAKPMVSRSEDFLKSIGSAQPLVEINGLKTINSRTSDKVSKTQPLKELKSTPEGKR